VLEVIAIVVVVVGIKLPRRPITLHQYFDGDSLVIV